MCDSTMIFCVCAFSLCISEDLKTKSILKIEVFNS